MNRLPLSTAALSAVAAIVLWYIAVRLEGEFAPPEVAEVSGVPEFGRQVEESPVLGGAAALRCREAEADMKELVESARYCESDNDCTTFDYGYPIQCLTAVARSAISDIRLQYREYERSCEYRVYYDCPSEPLERHPVCRENRCEVELRPRDFLRDETMQHLGIDDEEDSGD